MPFRSARRLRCGKSACRNLAIGETEFFRAEQTLKCTVALSAASRFCRDFTICSRRNQRSILVNSKIFFDRHSILQAAWAEIKDPFRVRSAEWRLRPVSQGPDRLALVLRRRRRARIA